MILSCLFCLISPHSFDEIVTIAIDSISRLINSLGEPRTFHLLQQLKRHPKVDGMVGVLHRDCHLRTKHADSFQPLQTASTTRSALANTSNLTVSCVEYFADIIVEFLIPPPSLDLIEGGRSYLSSTMGHRRLLHILSRRGSGRIACAVLSLITEILSPVSSLVSSLESLSNLSFSRVSLSFESLESLSNLSLESLFWKTY